MNSTPGSKWPVSGGVLEELLPQIPFPTPPPILKKVEALPPRPAGLFIELLGRPDALHADAVEHEDRYDATTVKLLEELVTTRRAPTDDERRILDDATFVFATEKTAAVSDHVKPSPMRRPVLHNEEEEEDGEPLDAAALTPFWWR